MHLNGPRTLKVALLAAVALLCSSCSVTQSLKTAVCQIHVGGGQGSGALIGVSGDLGLVLTCRHVAERVDAAAKLEWLGADGQVTLGLVKAVVTGNSFNNDLALIICHRPKGITPIPVAAFDPALGPWTAIGYRGGVMYVMLAEHADENSDRIKLDQPLIKGMSGGPLFDSLGRIVGVNVGSDVPPGQAMGVSMAISADGQALQRLVRDFSK